MRLLFLAGQDVFLSDKKDLALRGPGQNSQLVFLMF